MKTPVSIKRNDVTQWVEYRFTFSHSGTQSLLMMGSVPKCLLNVANSTKKVLDVFIISMDGRELPSGPRALHQNDFELIHDKPSGLSFVNVKGLEKEVNYLLQLNVI